ncbi:hypothetical protein [Paramagnetospirillum magneticum]|uniref:DUF2730 family protein n=1 Tax=Paramagnetospirillum magneticum (strain ATCC 700264 / AMB-1) TaxID=342108 RepID=Q2WA50_PARM1|nr:hypothetical protein [Paramagnetospirillum magneticum]BAE49275.1 hypothetical protein amb0471 [Paramagnetospirillum magneticum AMB-1]
MHLPEWTDIGLKVAEIVGALLGTIGGVLIWMVRHTLVSQDDLRARFEEHDEDHKELDKRLVDGERQFAAILADLEHLPDHEDIADLKDRIGAVEGSVKALGATIDGLKEVLERVERPLNILVEHHMNGGRK